MYTPKFEQYSFLKLIQYKLDVRCRLTTFVQTETPLDELYIVQTFIVPR